jgi:hypothetical protein
MWDNEGTRLLREVILPRLDAHENELRELRSVTWPVCQGILDKQMPFRNIDKKRRFLRWLDVDEIRRLIGLKSRYCGTDEVSSEEELRMITVVPSQEA